MKSPKMDSDSNKLDKSRFKYIVIVTVGIKLLFYFSGGVLILLNLLLIENNIIECIIINNSNQEI